MSSSRSMTREIGTAFAVLAIYLLTILAPLHQARASQLAFEQLGYSTLQTGWVLCSSADATGDDRDVTVAKCPAAGIGKNDLAEPSLDVLALTPDRATLAVAPPTVDIAFTPAASVPPSGSRAPPALV